MREVLYIMGKVVSFKTINGKTAQLVLDGNIVSVEYAGEVISRSAGHTWDNIKEPSVCSLYLDFIVNGYLKEKELTEEYDAILTKVNWR